MKTITLHVLPSVKCNNNCVFCIDRDGNELPSPEGFPAYFKKMLGKFGKVADRVVFSGFEPTMSPDLPALMELARAAGIRTIRIQTNGCRLADRKYLLTLLKAGLNSVSMSIHGSSAGVHDNCTRHKGSFAAAMSGLRNLLSVKKASLPWLEVKTTSVICRHNIRDLKNLVRLLVQLEGVSHSGFNPMVLRGNALRDPARLLVRYSAILDAWRAVTGKLFAASPQFRDRTGFTGMPACLLPEYNFRFGKYESVICIIPGRAELVKRDDEGGLKREKCAKCRFFENCPGIDGLYLDRYGWSEFKPVRSGPRDARPAA